MRNAILLLAISLYTNLHAQMELSGKLSGVAKGTKILVNTPFSNWTHPQNDQVVYTDENGSFKLVAPVKKPQTIYFRIDTLKFQLYSEPGKSLNLQSDLSNGFKEFQFRGSLANENTLRQQLQLHIFELIAPINTAEHPEMILKKIRLAQQVAFQKLKAAKAKVNKPFAEMAYYDIQYFAASRVWQAIWDLRINSTSYTDKPRREAWYKTLREAHKEVAISNDSAVNSFHYQQILAYYPHYFENQFASREEMQAAISSLLNKPFEEAVKEVRAKGEEFWEYNLYDKNFKGGAREAALAYFLVKCYSDGALGYQKEGLQKFATDFPSSKYLGQMKMMMQSYFASLAKANSAEYQFEPSDLDYTNLDSILATHKGKVVYLDLWGTWCGPCREEFAFTKELKERFKNSGVDFLYIAFEHKTNPEKYWKEMVQFYDLKGRHLLMGKALERYFRDLYKDTNTFSFPSYLLFDKNGKLVTKKAKRPSERENLYAEIEKLL